MAQDRKFASRVVASSGIQLPAQTTNTALTVDASGNLISSTTTATELGYVHGVTSSIQTQISGLQPAITTLPISQGGTNSSTALTGNKAIVSNGTQIIESATTSTEIGYVSGVTSSIQTQLGTKAPLASPTFTGTVTAPIVNISGQTASTVVVFDSAKNVVSSSVTSTTLGYLDATSSIQTQLNNKLSLSGGTLTGTLNMGANNITSSYAPASANDLTNKTYVDNLVAGLTWKNAVAAASAGSNINLAAPGTTLDGYTLNSGDRFLAKDQSTASQNGIYIFNGAAAAATRSTDMNLGTEVVGAVMLVVNGTVNIGSKWVNTNTGTVTIGSTNITFTPFSVSGAISGSGSANQVAYFTGTSVLSSEAQLATSRGGFGTNVSAFTGVVKASSGTFSAASVLPADLGTITDGVTLDQSGTGSTLEVKAGGISNTQVNASAAIALSKLASVGSNNVVLVSNGSGIVSASAVTSTTLGYLDATSSIQTQLNAKSSLITGDIDNASFAGANNVASAANVTGFAFANASVRAFSALISVYVNATTSLYETFRLEGIQKGASWDLSVSSVGDASSVVFSITAAGQIQYTSANYTGFSALTMKFRAQVTPV